MAAALAVVPVRQVPVRRRGAAVRRLPADRRVRPGPLAAAGQDAGRARALVPVDPQAVRGRVADPGRGVSAVDDRDDSSQAGFE